MKTFAVIMLVLGVLFLVSQIVVKRATNNTEAQAYEVLESYDSFEVRKYSAALYSYTVMKSDKYEKASSTGFRRLAGYIFGGNDKNQKIAMTTPVTMDMSDSITMKFKVPDGIDMDDLPKPNSKEVRFAEEPEKIVAAIRFGGKSSDEQITQYTNILKNALEKEGLEHTGQFSFLGYNPPYEVIGRRNEVIVELVR